MYGGRARRYHRWLFHDRDPEGWNILAVAHPWESGMDNSPRWDAALHRVDISNAPTFERRDIHTGDANVRPTDDDYARYCTLVKNLAGDNFGFRSARGTIGSLVRWTIQGTFVSALQR